MPVPLNPYPAPGPSSPVEPGNLANTYGMTGLAGLLQGIARGAEIGQNIGITREEMAMRGRQLDLEQKRLDNEAAYRKSMLEDYYGPRGAAAAGRAGRVNSPQAVAWAKSGQGMAHQAYDQQNGTDYFTRNMQSISNGMPIEIPPGLNAPQQQPAQSNVGGIIDWIKGLAGSKPAAATSPAQAVPKTNKVGRSIFDQ